MAKELRKDCLKSVPRVVMEEQKRSLERPTQTKELQMATEDLPNGKAAGPDGVPVDFFKVLWSEFGEKVTIFANIAFNSKDLGETNNKSNLVLLPKGSESHNIRNWRPISLLNAICGT